MEVSCSSMVYLMCEYFKSCVMLLCIFFGFGFFGNCIIRLLSGLIRKRWFVGGVLLLLS